MDASLTAALISGVGVILTAWLGFMGNRKGTLATAEQDFRKTILEENASLRERVSGLEQELLSVKLENHQFKVKLVELEKQSSSGGEEE